MFEPTAHLAGVLSREVETRDSFLSLYDVSKVHPCNSLGLHGLNGDFVAQGEAVQVVSVVRSWAQRHVEDGSYRWDVE